MKKNENPGLIQEKKKLLYSAIPSLLFVFVLWVIFFCDEAFDLGLKNYGLKPKTEEGLIGIFTSPFLHGDLQHIFSNSIPILILGTALNYFYHRIAYIVFFLIWMMSNTWVWISASAGNHIGASGIIYGLAAFIFLSGILRNDGRLMAISFLVAFMYGGLIWGIFPELFPEQNISWESHLFGGVAGIVMAIFFREKGPPKKKYSWDFEEEEDDRDDISTQIPEEDINRNVNIQYIYRDKNSESNNDGEVNT
ncbi:MAG: rhomboid family intramembrane serine protease [Bacteroidetes bacterium]|nr:rhomboid family intramembrane serine protease [Bacteroidota bacterium]